MTLLLAQAAEAVADQAQGLTGSDIALIIGAIVSGLVTLFQALGWTKAAKAAKQAKKTVEAVVDGVEDFQAEHPELADKARKMIRAKAEGLGVQDGPDGLADVVDRVRGTRRLTPPGGDKFGKILPVLLAAALFAMPGCAVGPAAERLIREECRSADEVLAAWPHLTPIEQLESAKDARAGAYAIRYAVLGDPLPEDLAVEAPGGDE